MLCLFVRVLLVVCEFPIIVRISRRHLSTFWKVLIVGTFQICGEERLRLIHGNSHGLKLLFLFLLLSPLSRRQECYLQVIRFFFELRQDCRPVILVVSIGNGHG
jgi:hypothetical protein